MEEEKSKRHYKVEVGDKITVKRQDVGDYTFYKVALKKKFADGTEAWFDKSLAFPRGTDLANGTIIRVNDFFEDVYTRKNDKYNAIWTLFISDYDICDGSAFNDYNKAKEEFNIDELRDDEPPF